MNVGFIGLGTLGRTIAKRLISEGVELNLWNRTRKKAHGLGMKVADSPAALVSSVDTLFLNLFDSEAVKDVMTGEEGLLKGDCKGKIIIDTTTNHFEPVKDFHINIKKAGGGYIEAPVLGSVVPASQGKLTVLVSGERESYGKVLPLLERIGRNIFFLEKPALATKMKLINNLTLGSFMATIAEALSFGEAAGIEKENILDILAAGGGNSLVLNAKREKLLKEDFSTHFSTDCIYKDLHCLQDLANTLKKPLFSATVVKELYGLARSRGMGKEDFSALYKVLKEQL